MGIPEIAARLDEIAREQGLERHDIEVWFGDEARIGQKNKVTRRLARWGTRPSAPHDQRTASTYIFGAICPQDGKAAGLILPWCNTQAMNLHLAEITAHVALGRHATLLMDQAGWHMSAKLVVRSNNTIVPLPPKCPELKRGGEHLAVHARQLVLKPRVHRLRKYRRPLLRRLEQTGALAHHDPGLARLGAQVLTKESRRKVACKAPIRTSSSKSA